MASTTGIELGRESCVLVGVRSSGAGTADVMALHTIETGAWPTMEVALVEVLRGLRRRKGFPRNARIVAWGLHDDPAGNAAVALQRPMAAAGFRIESVITPPQALALLAASRPRHTGEDAVAWLALNMQGAAIAIVHDGELLFARTFEWSYDTRVMTGKAQLLQRYSLVAQLAPEVHRGIAAVRAGRGISVEAAVTCGDLPDLRSLTMPLIEELDLEVETLDSTDGLRAVGKAKAERFAESAPTIRLACAAALAHSKQRPSTTRWVAGVAAAIGLVAALGWGSYAYWRGAVVNPAAPPRATAPATRLPSATERSGGPTGAAARGPGDPQVIARGPTPTQAATGTSTALGKTTPPGLPVSPAAGAAPITPAAKAEPRAIPPAKVEPLPVKPPPAVTASPGPADRPVPVPGPTRPVTAPAPGAAPPRTVAPPVSSAAPPRTAAPPVSSAPPLRTAAPPVASATPPRTVAPPGTGAPPPRAVPPPVSSPARTVAPPVTSATPPPTAAPPVSSAAPPRAVAPPVSSATPPRTVAPPVVNPPRPVAPSGASPTRTVDPPAANTAPPRTVSPPVVSPPRTDAAPAVIAAAPRTVAPPVAHPPRAVALPANRAQTPLRDPLPRVDSILIDQERRLAILDGTIVMVGDAVGPRVVVQIDRDAVVLREPSGLSVRVALRIKTIL
jgi:hypothetical protein